MLRKFHKTTYECWQRTSAPRKAAHCLQKEVGQNIKDKKRDKTDSGTETHSRKVVLKKRSYQTPVNALSGRSVVSLGISEGNITGKKNK